MRRLLILLAWLLLLTGAVAFHTLPEFNATPTAFDRCSFAPLPRAESFAKTKSYKKALDAFQTGYVRALYEGQKDIAERIRLRIGGLGKEIATNSLSDAWPFLTQFALLSSEFNKDSVALESHLWRTLPRPPMTFEYQCLRLDGATIWGERPKAECRTFWRILPEWDKKPGQSLYSGLIPDEKEEWPISRYTITYILHIQNGKQKAPNQIAINANTKSSLACWYKQGGTLKPNEPKGQGKWLFPTILASKGDVPGAIVLFTDNLDDRVLSIAIIHRYSPLSE